MSTITNLQDVPIDKIETDIMSVLYANQDIKFSQYTLFNKVLADKYDGQYSSQIHSNFKSKFLLVIRNLMSKYDDIKVYREGEIFWVVCMSESESAFEKSIKFKTWTSVIKQPISLDITDYAQMYSYLYEIDPTDFINLSDNWDGNTIFHELVLSQNKTIIQKLLLQDQFNFTVKNNHGKTPIEITTSQEINDILSKNLLLKLIFITEKIKVLEEQKRIELNKLESKVKFLESTEYKNKILLDANIKDIIVTKSSNFYEKYRLYIISASVCFITLRYLI